MEPDAAYVSEVNEKCCLKVHTHILQCWMERKFHVPSGFQGNFFISSRYIFQFLGIMFITWIDL